MFTLNMAVVTLEHNLNKKFRQIQKFFSATIFFKNSFFFFCGIASLVSTTYILFIKIGQTVFKKNHFLNFSFPLHNSQKMNFYSYHWEKFYFTWMRTYDRNFKLIRVGADVICLPGYALSSKSKKYKK